MAAFEVAGSIVSGASATAGLILVFLGSTATAYQGYEIQERNSVRSKYKLRAGVAFVGLLLAVAAAAFGLAAQWVQHNGLAVAAVALLAAAAACVLFAAYKSFEDIK